MRCGVRVRARGVVQSLLDHLPSLLVSLPDTASTRDQGYTGSASRRSSGRIVPVVMVAQAYHTSSPIRSHGVWEGEKEAIHV
jgi:hypothetical protein